MSRRLFFTLASALLLSWQALLAQTTAFSYQGQLNDGGAPANGSYDFRFAIYDAVTNGNRVSYFLTNSPVAVSNGLFTVALDFGVTPFPGADRWLDIGVKTSSVTNFTDLSPRQPVLPVPYALHAAGASNLLGTLPATQLAGTLSSAQFAGTYGSQVNFTNAGNNFAGFFSGNGAALTNLNAGNLASGTVVDARLSTNVPLRNANQTFTGANTFTGTNTMTNWGNTFVGNFSGNGLVQWVQVSGAATQAVRDVGYLLLNSGLTTVTLPVAANMQVGDIVRVSGAGAGGWRVALNAGQSVIGNFSSYRFSPWTKSSSPLSLDFSGIASDANGIRMAACVNGGQIYSSSDSGRTWSALSASASGAWSAIASSSDGSILAATIRNGGSIYVSTNAGISWNSTTAMPNWSSVTVSADGVKMAAAASNGVIYVSSNTGVTWSSTSSGTLGWSGIASSDDGAKIVAVVNGGKIHTSQNSGANWTQQSQPPTANWSCVASSADGSRLVAAVNGGGIYTSGDSGASWTQQINAPAAAWSAIACSSDGGRIAAVVNGGGIYCSADAGATWTKQAVSDNAWRGVCSSADGTRVAAAYGGSGSIYHWQAQMQFMTSGAGAAGFISGSQGAAVELQFIGNNQFMPVSSAGIIWAN